MNEQGFFEPEYASVYGVPFAFIPTDRPVTDPKPPKPVTLVRTVEGRDRQRIVFPKLAGYRLEIGAPRPLTAGDMVVPARARRDGDAPVAIDWRVTPGPDGWRILDVIVEGVSLALTWRNEFDAVIDQRGLDGLLQQMASRAERRMASAS